DFLGQQVLQEFEHKHLSSSQIQIDRLRPTGTVGVTFPSHGSPQYTIHENVAWDHLTATQQALSALAKADAICFGSLSQRNPASRAAILSLLQATPKSALIVFDINLRQAYYTPEVIKKSLQLANIFKLNSDEMEVLTEMFEIPGNLEQKIMWLAEA